MSVLVLGCDLAPPPEPALFDGIVLAREVAVLGDLVLVANDVESALAAPPGSVPETHLHDLLVLSRASGSFTRAGSFDAPAGPPRRFARRITVDASRNLAYLTLGDATDSGVVQIVDLADPTHPSARALVDVGRPVLGVAAEGGLLATVGPSGLRLFDVKDPDAPVARGSLVPAEDAGLSDVALEGGRAFVVGTAGTVPNLFLQPRMLIVDVSDPEAPRRLGEHRFASGFQGLGVTVEVRGERAFLLGDLGLDVLDVSDPSFPYSVGGIPPAVRTPAALFTDVEIAGDVALLVTRGQGVQAVDVSFPPAPVPLGTYPDTAAAGARAVSVALAGMEAFAALDRIGIRSLVVDEDRDGVLSLADACPVDPDPAQADVDFDGVGDACDLCVEEGDPGQVDADGDGYGNRCDADLDASGVVNFADLALLRLAFFGTDPVADLDGDGVVNFADLARMRLRFFAPPGPSARAPR